jgi:DNA-binding beta-propeller fold protein YncE
MNMRAMRIGFLLIVTLVIVASSGQAQLKSGPPLPQKLVRNWAKLPPGWNFGECVAVSVDKDDNVWVYNRGKHPVIQFDKNGKVLQAWGEEIMTYPHGIKVGDDGNIWTVDQRHVIFKLTPVGQVLMTIGRVNSPGDNDNKGAFSDPTGIAFAPNGDIYISDGYVNSRVIKFNKDGDYLLHWGKKGTGDGEFNIVHDVTLDSQGRVYVADRTNKRVQIFDGNGNFLGKWTDVGTPWGFHYVAKENVLYMADGSNNRIVKLNLEGQILGVLGGPGRVQGKFGPAGPHHIAVDSTGAIYVAEIQNRWVQKFAP